LINDLPTEVDEKTRDYMAAQVCHQLGLEERDFRDARHYGFREEMSPTTVVKLRNETVTNRALSKYYKNHSKNGLSVKDYQGYSYDVWVSPCRTYMEREKRKVMMAILAVMAEFGHNTSQLTKKWDRPITVAQKDSVIVQAIHDDSTGECTIHVDEQHLDGFQDSLEAEWEKKFWYDVPKHLREGDKPPTSLSMYPWTLSVVRTKFSKVDMPEKGGKGKGANKGKWKGKGKGKGKRQHANAGAHSDTDHEEAARYAAELRGAPAQSQSSLFKFGMQSEPASGQIGTSAAMSSQAMPFGGTIPPLPMPSAGGKHVTSKHSAWADAVVTSR